MFANFTAFLFERPVRLLVVACFVQFLLICLWSWRRSVATARAVCAGFVVTPVFILLSMLVVTDRERVARVCESVARFVERGDIPAFGECIDDAFEAEHWDRSAFLDRVRRALQAYKFRDVRVSGFEFRELSDAGAVEVEFDVSCRVQGADVDVDRLLTRWRLRFRGEAAEWRITRIEPIATPFSPIRGWGDVPR